MFRRWSDDLIHVITSCVMRKEPGDKQMELKIDSGLHPLRVISQMNIFQQGLLKFVPENIISLCCDDTISTQW